MNRGDRLKLMSLIPIYETVSIGNAIRGNNVSVLNLKDSVLIPVTVETTVRIIKKFPFNFQYRYSIRLQDSENIDRVFYDKSYYPELLENIRLYKEYIKSKNASPDSFVVNSGWMAGSPGTVQQDILDVHTKALFYASAFQGDKEDARENYMIQASSFRDVPNRCSIGIDDVFEKDYEPFEWKLR